MFRHDSNFHSKHSSQISNGEPDRPLIVHVGRLGVEKSLDFLKRYFSCHSDVNIITYHSDATSRC